MEVVEVLELIRVEEAAPLQGVQEEVVIGGE